MLGLSISEPSVVEFHMSLILLIMLALLFMVFTNLDACYTSSVFVEFGQHSISSSYVHIVAYVLLVSEIFFSID